MKPNYRELLKAFILSCKSNKSQKDEEYIKETIERLKASEDWPKIEG